MTARPQVSGAGNPQENLMESLLCWVPTVSTIQRSAFATAGEIGFQIDCELSIIPKLQPFSVARALKPLGLRSRRFFVRGSDSPEDSFH